MSITAIENNLTEPQFKEENGLIIRDGKHPLLSSICDNDFIPNSCIAGKNGLFFNQRKSFINIVTGPNNSGKSVYIKQCGIIAYMAHIGSFVPAKEAIVGRVDMFLNRQFAKTVKTVKDFEQDSDKRRQRFHFVVILL
ncbi:mutS protein [Bonamia ostreae]|uniref:MutS protein n=1 Tax=Bonamia ostreae TaxID=126728 RepID=A0ABV2AM06_9EUKA